MEENAFILNLYFRWNFLGVTMGADITQKYHKVIKELTHLYQV